MSLLPSLDRLPSGRHPLDRTAVDDSQRERMLVAMLNCIHARGYATTTVADVVAAASVSRTTFYRHFPDKEACFVAAYDYALHLVERSSQPAVALGQDWRARVRSELTGYLGTLATEPVLATTLHLEALAAGHMALDHRAQLLGLLASRIAALNEAAREQNGDLPEIPPAAFALYTGGLDELIRDRLRTATAAALRDLVDPVAEAIYALFGATP